jgi:cell division protein FtsB
MPRLRWMFIAAATSLFMIIMGTVYFFEIQNIVRLRSLIEKRSAERAEKKRSVERRREEVEFYATETGIVHLSREKYGLILPGEKVYMIIGASADVSYSR